MRVNELAKELNVTSKELLGRLRAWSYEIKSHSSGLTDEQIERARSAYAGSAPAAQPAAPKPPPATETKAPAARAPVAVAEEPPAPPPEPEPAPEPEPEEPPVLILRGPIVVKDLAEHLGLKPNQLIAELMSMNIFASINMKLEIKVARMVAEKHGVTVEQEKKAPERKPVAVEEPKEKPKTDSPEDLLPRPPVVTFLGHVDHGKTSLLDRIRHTHVAQGEHGGITQHIGAYTVELNDQKITFIDTPGHAAFTKMRARGANLTDIAVIIIAADEGIMPQTREAIQHARAAGVTIMAAVNKIDLRNAQVDRVKQQLQAEGLAPEDWGGSVICCPVSAQTGEGIDHLLEMILLQAEVLELRANANRPAEGFVIEAHLEAGMGPTATVLVKRGTLKLGDTIVCGPYWGRVKALIGDNGRKLRTAGPSMAVKCLGLNSTPEAGAEFTVVENDRAARGIAEERVAELRTQKLGTTRRKTTLDDLLRQTDATTVKELNIVLKADMQGTLEAIEQSLTEIKSDKVTLRVLLSGVGNITENDVILASASDAIVVGFNVAKDGGAGATAKREGVEIRLYSIIYELLDDIRQAMTGLLQPVSREQVIGHAEIRQIFEISKKWRVAGCMVVDGRVTSRARARILRGGDLVYEGRISSLKRFQNDAAEVREGQECGIRLENFNDYQEGDRIEFFDVQQIAQEL